MSIDDRLRTGLARNAESVDPSVERHLATVLTRTRRHTLLVRAVTVAVMGTLAAVSVTVGPSVIGAMRNGTDVAVPPAATSSFPAVTGAFATTLANSIPGIGDNGLAGRWTFQFRPDGTLVVDAPEAYVGILSAALFEATPGQFRTDVFGQDLCSGTAVGTYGWTRSGSALTFSVLDDACEARVAVFTSAAWQQVP